MDRRKSLKALMVGTVSTGVLIDACKTEDKKATTAATTEAQGSKIPRYDDELAHEKQVLIDETKHKVLKAAHPSPFSADKGFFGCRHFSKTNEYLVSIGKQPINWKIE